MCRIRETVQEKIDVIDVDGSYLYRKCNLMNQQGLTVVSPIPTKPIAGWEVVTKENYSNYRDKIPEITQGILI